MSGPRVTTEQARLLVESIEATVCMRDLGGAPRGFSRDEDETRAVALDLLDARAEIERLRATVAGVTEGELAKAMHAERLEREGCRSNYADERWDESKADRERWYATARVALRMMGGEK